MDDFIIVILIRFLRQACTRPPNVLYYALRYYKHTILYLSILVLKPRFSSSKRDLAVKLKDTCECWM